MRYVFRRQRQRALPSGLPLLAGGASSADSAKGLCPLDSRSSPERRPMRTAAGLCPAPAGDKPPDPEMLTHLHFACGRDGGFWCVYNCLYSTDRPAIRTAGRSVSYVVFMLNGFYIVFRYQLTIELTLFAQCLDSVRQAPKVNKALGILLVIVACIKSRQLFRVQRIR